MSKERPILMSAPMVLAILEGRKTQTRRVMKPQPIFIADSMAWRWDTVKGTFRGAMGTHIESFPETAVNYCPYGKPGDRLWVREAFGILGGDIIYRAGPHEVDGYAGM